MSSTTYILEIQEYVHDHLNATRNNYDTHGIFYSRQRELNKWNYEPMVQITKNEVDKLE